MYSVLRMLMIKKNDEGEFEDGLDKDLAELIDYGFENEDDPEAMNKFLKDLMSQDREQLKRVIQRNFQNKRRKREQFEINIDEEERIQKKVKRMEEAIKALEENEKKLFEDGGDSKKREEDDDLFDDDHAIKRFNLQKASNQLRKTFVKTTPKKSESQLFVSDDTEILDIIEKNQLEKKTQKTAELPKLTTSSNLNRMATKNSILTVKESKNNISLYNNQGNKEVLNEFGGRNNLFNVLEKQQQMSGSNKSQTAPPSSSLNKLFAQSNNNDIKNKTTSPNKVFIFKTRINNPNQK